VALAQPVSFPSVACGTELPEAVSATPNGKNGLLENKGKPAASGASICAPRESRSVF